MATPQLSIVIPAYNESARIERTLQRVMECVRQQGWDAEVLVVDDGSQDRTVEIVRGWMEREPRLFLVQNNGNRGKGYSVRNGLLQATGDEDVHVAVVVVIEDGDPGPVRLNDVGDPLVAELLDEINPGLCRGVLEQVVGAGGDRRRDGEGRLLGGIAGRLV